MLGKIIEIRDEKVKVKMSIDINLQPSLSNLHVVFEEDGKKVVGEITTIDEEYLTIVIIGEIIAGRYFPGVQKKPSFKAGVRIINMEELSLILGPSTPSTGTFYLGESSIYNNYGINIGINNFFSNHFAIIGNSGSGKSCATATIMQNLFYSNHAPVNSNIFVFDAYGEYHHAFAKLNEVNPNIAYKSITTNPNELSEEQLRIPLWLMGTDGIAMLLDVNEPNQIPIIEKTLTLLPILSRNDESVQKYKNHIIAKCLRDIILTGKSASSVRNQIISVLTYYNTPDLNLDLKIVEPGYTRTLKQCLYVNDNDSMSAIENVVGAITHFIIDDLDYTVSEPVPFTLEDFDKALSFALISEGILKSDKVYDDNHVLKVRLESLMNGSYKEYFNIDKYITKEQFIDSLVKSKDGEKKQIINFNISYVDDRFAKVLVKIISKLLFEYSLALDNRASFPIHILLEEAHRYVQNDNDINILGYNIFERITKEGRKYGVILGMISQRPSEISETAISQCANFLVFRMQHPKDLNYIREMVPNITEEMVPKFKVLQPGNCVAFGVAFKLPMQLKLDMPSPTPLSQNIDISKCWY